MPAIDSLQRIEIVSGMLKTTTNSLNKVWKILNHSYSIHRTLPNGGCIAKIAKLHFNKILEVGQELLSEK